MGKVIEFLARAGSDASLRHASVDTVRAALLEAGIDDDDICDLVAANDGDGLRAHLGLRVFFGSQLPVGPGHEEEEAPLDGEDEDGDGEPDGNISRTPAADSLS
ncbi:hypothetical protein ACQKIE_02625 [Luteibacter sp. NPDC031894]|jgi:hypothetical protein|uniref:hypothetical protein n=1 Tax=Luteibacter sp. NPDC031894 TaxID=3390572 RepID=UPI003CFC82E9